MVGGNSGLASEEGGYKVGGWPGLGKLHHINYPEKQEDAQNDETDWRWGCCQEGRDWDISIWQRWRPTGLQLVTYMRLEALPPEVLENTTKALVTNDWLRKLLSFENKAHASDKYAQKVYILVEMVQ